MYSIEVLSKVAQLSSLADETPEGRSIVTLAEKKYGQAACEYSDIEATFIPFTAQTRMSGINIGNRHIRKGSSIAIEQYVQANGGLYPPHTNELVERIAKSGCTPLVGC